MRRNAESLLVLAGAEPPRRRGRPVALADVVRVAIGEVEDFARISLLALDDVTVGGNVAVDLAHLLSELMENATHFSPPDTTVEIVGHRSDDGLHPLGERPGHRHERRSAGRGQPPAGPPAARRPGPVSRSLGFIVIGRLAARFGISVKLTVVAVGWRHRAGHPAGRAGHRRRPAAWSPRRRRDPADGRAPAPARRRRRRRPRDRCRRRGRRRRRPRARARGVRADAGPGRLRGRGPRRSRPRPTPSRSRTRSTEVDRGRRDRRRRRVDRGRPSSADELVEDARRGAGSYLDAVPEGDEFERGLQSLVSDELAPGPVEGAPGSAPDRARPRPTTTACPGPSARPRPSTRPRPRSSSERPGRRRSRRRPGCAAGADHRRGQGRRAELTAAGLVQAHAQEALGRRHRWRHADHGRPGHRREPALARGSPQDVVPLPLRPQQRPWWSRWIQ